MNFAGPRSVLVVDVDSRASGVVVVASVVDGADVDVSATLDRDVAGALAPFRESHAPMMPMPAIAALPSTTSRRLNLRGEVTERIVAHRLNNLLSSRLH
jgi:hypothetical protein